MQPQHAQQHAGAPCALPAGAALPPWIDAEQVMRNGRCRPALPRRLRLTLGALAAVGRPADDGGILTMPGPLYQTLGLGRGTWWRHLAELERRGYLQRVRTTGRTQTTYHIPGRPPGDPAALLPGTAFSDQHSAISMRADQTDQDGARPILGRASKWGAPQNGARDRRRPSAQPAEDASFAVCAPQNGAPHSPPHTPPLGIGVVRRHQKEGVVRRGSGSGEQAGPAGRPDRPVGTPAPLAPLGQLAQGSRLRAHGCELGLRAEDLGELGRLRIAFEWAQRRGWLVDCEHDWLELVARAIHARRQASRSPVGYFVRLLREPMFAVPECDYDAAAAWLRASRGERPARLDPTEEALRDE